MFRLCGEVYRNLRLEETDLRLDEKHLRCFDLFQPCRYSSQCRLTWLFESLKPVRIRLDIWQQLMSATATSSQFELLLAAAIKSIMFPGNASMLE